MPASVTLKAAPLHAGLRIQASAFAFTQKNADIYSFGLNFYARANAH